MGRKTLDAGKAAHQNLVVVAGCEQLLLLGRLGSPLGAPHFGA